jgi:hypothetical protein
MRIALFFLSLSFILCLLYLSLSLSVGLSLFEPEGQFHTVRLNFPHKNEVDQK